MDTKINKIYHFCEAHKDKYPNLAEAARDVVVYSIGEDDVVLDSETRTKAVQSFRALSWAFYEGGK